MDMDFAEQVRQSKMPKRISREVFDALQFIADHTMQYVGLDDVAAHVGISRSFLTRRFRTKIGKSVNETIMKMKLRDAKRLLRYSDMALGEIANYQPIKFPDRFQEAYRLQSKRMPPPS